jgi:3-oxoacyl-[acyl-carrier protein] reductase
MRNEKSINPVVLITGAATGVGRACAQKFAALGYDVVVSYLQADESEALITMERIQASGGDHLPCPCDVTSNDDVAAMAGQIRSRYGRLDVVVNCAGLTDRIPHHDLDAMTEEKWDQILAVNTKGPFLVVRATVPLLKEGLDAAIVNVSSEAGISGFGSCLAYCASKGALNTMTKSLARALAPEIRVNAVCPGPIDSRWLRQWMDEEKLATYADDFPIPRLSTPDDIADSVLYLAHTTKMTTGQLLVVDGGGRSL